MKHWTDEEFIQAVKNNTSIAGVVRSFGLCPKQGHYNRAFHKTRKRLNLDISHFKSPSIGREKESSFEEVFCVNSKHIWGTSLRKKILKYKLKLNKCELCHLNSQWNGKDLTLQVDHINGINNDNRLENLRLLCPNCHSQTSTYSGRNQKKQKKKHYCTNCNQLRDPQAKVCRSCFQQPSKITWLSSSELLKELETKSYTQLGKDLGVSDNAIRKHLKTNGVVPPKKGKSNVA